MFIFFTQIDITKCVAFQSGSLKIQTKKKRASPLIKYDKEKIKFVKGTASVLFSSSMQYNSFCLRGFFFFLLFTFLLSVFLLFGYRPIMRVVINDTNLSNNCLANCLKDDTCLFDVSISSGPFNASFNPFFPPFTRLPRALHANNIFYRKRS